MASSLTIMVLIFLSVLFNACEARDVLVGGSENAWKIPVNSSDSLNQWAEKTRFKVGDVLILKYDEKVDSVLEVTKEDYESCKTNKPIKEFKDGSIKVELDKSGPFFFISGADGHCHKGQKLEVVVMSEKHWDHRNSPAPAPANQKSAAATTHLLRAAGFFGLSLSSLLGFASAFAFALA